MRGHMFGLMTTSLLLEVVVLRGTATYWHNAIRPHSRKLGAAPGAQGAGILLEGVVGCPRSAHGRFTGFIRGLRVSSSLRRPIPMRVLNP